MDGRKKSLKSILKKAANATRNNKNYKRPRINDNSGFTLPNNTTITFGRTPFNAGLTINTLNIPPNGLGKPVVRKSTTRRRLSKKNLENLIIGRRGSYEATNKNDIIVGRAMADASEAYDNLDDMIRYIELRAAAEGWSDNILRRTIKRLKWSYQKYDENTKRNNTLIKDTLVEIDEQFSGDINMAIQYVEMLARVYNWTDELKKRVIQAVEDKYA
jgi:hypothetical protein